MAAEVTPSTALPAVRCLSARRYARGEPCAGRRSLLCAVALIVDVCWWPSSRLLDGYGRRFQPEQDSLTYRPTCCASASNSAQYEPVSPTTLLPPGCSTP